MLDSLGWKNLQKDFDLWRERENRSLIYSEQSDLQRGEARGSVHWFDFCRNLHKSLL